MTTEIALAALLIESDDLDEAADTLQIVDAMISARAERMNAREWDVQP